MVTTQETTVKMSKWLVDEVEKYVNRNLKNKSEFPSKRNFVDRAVMKNDSLTEDEITNFTKAANEEFSRMKVNNIQTILNRRGLEVALSEPKLIVKYVLKNMIKFASGVERQ